MGDLLQQGSDWLEAQRHSHMSREVVYSRGALSVLLSATVGRSEFEQTDEYGMVHRVESRDYLLRAADLVLPPSPGDPGAEPTAITPRAGDLVRETIGGEVFAYEVGAPDNRPPYRPSDPGRVTLRVHTHLVSQEPSP